MKQLLQFIHEKLVFNKNTKAKIPQNIKNPESMDFTKEEINKINEFCLTLDIRPNEITNIDTDKFITVHNDLLYLKYNDKNNSIIIIRKYGNNNYGLSFKSTKIIIFTAFGEDNHSTRFNKLDTIFKKCPDLIKQLNFFDDMN